MTTPKLNTTNNKHFNGKLIYQYVQNYLDNIDKGLDRINQKLTGIIGFSAVLIKFAGELNNSTIEAVLVKLIAILSLLISIGCALIGLFSKISGSIVDPEELTEKWWYKSEEEIQLFVIRQWFNTISDLQKESKRRSLLLNISFSCIAICSFCFAVSYLLFPI